MSAEPVDAVVVEPARVNVPDFAKLPLGTLAAVYEATGVDLMTRDNASRFWAWGYFVRHGQDPAFTIEDAKALTIEDLDFTQSRVAGPNPTSKRKPR